MKKLLLVLISTSCFSQVFVSPELTIGSSTASKDWKGEFGIGGKLGIGYKIGKLHLSLVGSVSNFTYTSPSQWATDARGNKTNEITSSYSATYIGTGVKIAFPIYCPNGSGIYGTFSPEYNFINSVTYTIRERNNPKSIFNTEGSYTRPQLSQIGGAFSVEAGIGYRLVGKNEFGFGASYKIVFSKSEIFPTLGMFGLNVVYQLNFKKKD